MVALLPPLSLYPSFSLSLSVHIKNVRCCSEWDVSKLDWEELEYALCRPAAVLCDSQAWQMIMAAICQGCVCVCVLFTMPATWGIFKHLQAKFFLEIAQFSSRKTCENYLGIFLQVLCRFLWLPRTSVCSGHMGTYVASCLPPSLSLLCPRNTSWKFIDCKF